MQASKRWFGGEAVRGKGDPLVITGLSIVLVQPPALQHIGVPKCHPQRGHETLRTIIAARHGEGTQLMK